jgi:hypothetical protein
VKGEPGRLAQAPARDCVQLADLSLDSVARFAIINWWHSLVGHESVGRLAERRRLRLRSKPLSTHSTNSVIASTFPRPTGFSPRGQSPILVRSAGSPSPIRFDDGSISSPGFLVSAPRLTPNPLLRKGWNRLIDPRKGEELEEKEKN